jgi:hypothetical protein
MGKVKPPLPVRFFASIIFRDPGMLPQVEAELAHLVGPVAERTDVFPFSQSDYYSPEMGEGLRRCFLLFEPLLEREMLADVKLWTNGIESSRSENGRRSVNVDPGYIALEHVVLGTTKGYSHRIYVGKGIFADLTLLYESGSYRRLKWTYPDYGSEQLIVLLNGWREHYKRLLRCRKA